MRAVHKQVAILGMSHEYVSVYVDRGLTPVRRDTTQLRSHCCWEIIRFMCVQLKDARPAALGANAWVVWISEERIRVCT